MSTLRFLRAACPSLLLGALVFGPGCGGGGGTGTSTLTFQTTTAVSIQSSGVLEGTAGLKVGQFVTIGLATGLRFGLFPFLDHDDTIVSARLRLRQVAVSGTPYPDFGSVVVDRVDFGAALGAGDQAPPVLASAIGTLSSDATLGVKEVDVTAQVAAAVALDAFTIDFRLRFGGLLLRPTVDIASFEDAAGGLGTADVPQLIVEYR